MALIGLVALWVCLSIQLTAFFAARWAVAVIAGIPSAWAPFRRFDVPPEGTPRWARPMIGVAGPAATYALAALCFVAALKVTPRPVFDATIDVRPGGPAEVAGMRSGDRVLSIQGRPVSAFGDISARLREAGQAGALKVDVERGGERWTVVVTPMIDATGTPKIGVIARAPTSYTSVGLGEAIVDGIAMPARLAKGVVDIVGGRGRGPDEAAGPIAIVTTSAGARAPGPGALTVVASLLTQIGALLAPLALVFALFGWRPRASARAGGEESS